MSASMMWCEAVGGFCDGELFQVFEGVKYVSFCKVALVLEAGEDGLYTEVEKIRRFDFALNGKYRERAGWGLIWQFEYVGDELLDFWDEEEDAVIDEDCEEGEGKT